MTDQRAQEILKLVQRNYQDIAADFDVSRQKALWPEIIRLAEQVPPGTRVLDAGCGNGRLLAAFTGRTLDYTGLDNSPALLELAQKNYPQARFILGDILQLSVWPENNFSYIFCLAVWQHIPSVKLRRAALQQLAAKLAPGGQLIISVWNLWSQARFRRLLFKASWSKILGKSDVDRGDLIFPWKNPQGQEISQRYYHAFTKRELRRLAQASGLTILSLLKDQHNYWLILKK